jgi:hypothetical protein
LIAKENIVYIHNVILFNHKKNAIPSFSAPWMGPEVIMLSKIRQTPPVPICRNRKVDLEKQNKIVVPGYWKWGIERS